MFDYITFIIYKRVLDRYKERENILKITIINKETNFDLYLGEIDWHFVI